MVGEGVGEVCVWESVSSEGVSSPIRSSPSEESSSSGYASCGVVSSDSCVCAWETDIIEFF